MKHLLAFGGYTNHDFGILTNPRIDRGPFQGIKDGMLWAMDNDAFNSAFNYDLMISTLRKQEPYKDTCLFVVMPDKVGDAIETKRLFLQWYKAFDGWPLAFVAQDGQEDLMFPDPALWSTLFIGGTDKFKDSYAAVSCIQRAQELGKRIHIGRVNHWRRYQFFSKLQGSEDFTCDGTKHRFIGTQRAVKLWSSFRDRVERQMGLDIPFGDSAG